MTEITYNKGQFRSISPEMKRDRSRFCNVWATIGTVGLLTAIYGLSHLGDIKNKLIDYTDKISEKVSVERSARVSPYVLSFEEIPAEPGRGASHYAHEEINQNPILKEFIEKGYFTKNDLTAYIDRINRPRGGFVAGKGVLTPQNWKTE